MRTQVRRIFTAVAAFLAIPAYGLSLGAQQLGVVVSGRVTSQGGGPVAAAQVFIPELSIGAQTVENGGYSFRVPGARATGQEVTLSVRAIGYKPVSARITLSPGQNVTQNFTVASNPLQLGTVVVTGAGTQAAVEALGTVHTSVDTAAISRSHEANVVQALAGKAPGVEVTGSSGEPGAGSYIRIRGSRTLVNSGQPLFVVDGVPIDNSSYSTTNFNPQDAGNGNGFSFGQDEGTGQTNRAGDINPNDIESVEVLKGAAAGAIYGASAGQGVILITTKKGRPGQTHYSLVSSLASNRPSKYYPLQRKYSQGRSNHTPDEWALAVGLPAGSNCNDPGGSGGDAGFGECLRSWGPAIPAGQPTYDHAREAFQTGYISDNNLSVSGGSERTTFFLSGSFNDNYGLFKGPNNSYKRTTFRVNASHRLFENFKVGANASFADSRGSFIQRGNNTNGLLLGLYRTPPNFNNLPYLDPESHLHRSYNLQHPGPSDLTADRIFDNPFFVLYEATNNQNTGRVFGDVNAEYTPISWLRFNYTLGTDYAADERLEGQPISSTDVATGGRVTSGDIVNYGIDHNLTATATYKLTDNIKGDLTLGQNLNSRTVRILANVGRQLVADRPFNLSNTVQIDVPPVHADTLVHRESYFGQSTVSLYDQLFLTAGLRSDASSAYDAKHRRALFPKASAAWTFSKSLLPENQWITTGKLRAAYGETGQDPAPYLTEQTFFNGNVGGIVQGTALGTAFNGLGGLQTNGLLASNILKPERTREFETGFDLGLYRDKADFSFTFYNARTEGAVFNLTLPPSFGYTRQALNGVDLRNRGIEMVLNLRPLTTSNYAWDVGLQWARNRNLVTNIDGPSFVDLNGFIEQIAQAGKPLGVFRGQGWVRCGLSPNEAAPDLESLCAGKPRGATYLAEDGLPVNDDSYRIIGDPNPKWTGSVRSGLRLWKVQLSGLVDIKKGGDIWNGTKYALYSYGTHKDTEKRAVCHRDFSGAVGTPDVDVGALVCDPGTNDKSFGSSGFYPGPVVGPGVDPATGKGILVPIGENWYRNAARGPACPFIEVDEPCIEDGGYVKLREISLAYSINSGWLNRSLGVSSIDLRVAGRNLKTWTKYTGLDPETNTGGQIEQVRGTDYFNLPQSRSIFFSIGLNR